METDYTVLRNAANGDPSSSGYALVAGDVKASSAAAAIRVVADKLGAGTYVAIPRRSFKPVTVTVETKQIVSLG